MPGPVHARRLSAQLLSGPPAGRPEDVAGRLLAVQAQDPRGARLAVRSRSTGLRAGDVDRALTVDRSLAVDWLNRGTLHLVRREDHHWLHALTTPQLARGNARRLAQEGVDPAAAERGVAVVERALADSGPLPRGALREHLRRADVPVAGQALVHVLVLVGLRGLAVRGPMVGTEQAWVLRRDWWGPPPPPLGRDLALGELAGRYLAGHGPASDRDLARWAGVTLGDARRGLRACPAPLQEEQGGLVDLAGHGRARPVPPPRLLGAFDPLLLGWVSREDVTGPHTRIVTVNGVFRPVALVGGRAVATWGYARGQVELAPFAPLSGPTAAALRADAVDVVRFLQG